MCKPKKNKHNGERNKLIEWIAVRPDTLINEDIITEYEVYASPVRSAMFNPGKTSRINVGNFMARLIVENDLWNKWKGQMPVVYNKMDYEQTGSSCKTTKYFDNKH